MDKASGGADEPNLPRYHFHLTLGLIFIPFGAIIGGWTLAIVDVLKGYSSPAQLTWMRLLVALVLIDALVVGAAIYMGAHQEEFLAKTPESKRVMLGLSFERDDSLKVHEVAPEFPAARAGV